MPVVYGIEVQLLQLFQNLISNALKFTQSTVTPKISITATSEPSSNWLFAFEDNGIGIADDDLQMIFQTFRRLHHDDQYPGSGIGLATCRKIVEVHAGDIWVESVEGQGSTFFVKIPGIK